MANGYYAMSTANPVVNRLKLLVTRQIQKLALYRELLARELVAINESDAEKLAGQQHTEQELIAELLALRKVVAPLEKMYQATSACTDPGLELLYEEYNRLKATVLADNARNQQLVKTKLLSLDAERRQLKKNVHSSFFHNSQPAAPVVIDVLG